MPSLDALHLSVYTKLLPGHFSLLLRNVSKNLLSPHSSTLFYKRFSALSTVLRSIHENGFIQLDKTKYILNECFFFNSENIW